MEIHYHPLLVFISVIIASFGSWVALSVIRGIEAFSTQVQQQRLLLASMAFAAGTWSMHFVAMLALRLPFDLLHDPGLVAVSLVSAVAGAAPAFWIIQSKKHEPFWHIVAAMMLVVAIGAMHFTALHALSVSPMLSYNPALVLLAAIVSGIAAYAGLGIGVFWPDIDRQSYYVQGAGALVLGLAVSALHYIAVAAINFPDAGANPIFSHGVGVVALVRVVISSTLLILLLLLFTSLRSDHFAGWRLLTIIAVAEVTATSFAPVLVSETLPKYFEAFMNAALLVLLVFPAAWRLNVAGVALLESKREAEENLQGQQAVNQLLALPTHQLELHEVLGKALSIVMNISWLQTLPKGAIYLADTDKGILRLAAQYNLPAEIAEKYAQIDYAYCCCGQAVVQKKSRFCSHLETNQERRYPEMQSHGHYTVPLLAGGQVEGVLCLYVDDGHTQKTGDLPLIEALAATIGSLIVRKRAEHDLQLADTVFKHNLSCLMVTDAETRILKVNPMFLKVTGYQRKDLIGRTPAILKSGRQDAAFYAAMWERLQKEGTWSGEIWNRRKNSEVYPEWLSITAVRDSKGVTTNYVATFIDISVQKEAEARIEQLAYFDAVTGLANRILFYNHLQKALAHAQRERGQVVLLFIDLDHFKSVNDTLGHDVGDELLKDVSMRLQRSVRDSDILARLGGDEFVAILVERSGEKMDAVEAARKVVERIIHALAEPFEYGRQSFHCGASIGIAVYPNDGNTSNELMQRADTAMYEAKRAGRSTYCFFSQAMSDTIERRLRIEQALRKAIAAEELSLYYQPQVDTESRQIIGAEALLRWRDGEMGDISPEEFVPVAEDCGIIRQLGEWVFAQVCRQRAVWDNKGYTQLSQIALNVSIHQLLNQNFVKRLTDILQQSGVAPEGIELEITEGGLARYPSETNTVIRALRKLGFKLAIDDFGTDYSSLSRLKSFDVQLLKIDQSFVRDMTVDSDDAAIVRAVIDMGHALGMTVMAEGVETREQAVLLNRYGCSRCQGYYFGKPMLADDFELLLQNGLSASDLMIDSGNINSETPDTAECAGRA